MYNLNFTKQSLKFIEKQEKSIKDSIKKALLKLAENPYDRTNNDIVKMKDNTNSYRLRKGDIRAIFKIDNGQLIITVIKIDNRGQVYK